MQETQKPKLPLIIPTGFKFYPTEEELVRDYLYNKITNKPLPYHGAVKECNLYGNQEPWEIWATQGGTNLKPDECLYVFTELKRKSPNDSRFVRKVGLSGGAWRGEDSAQYIKAQNTKEPIAIRKRFRYENSGSRHDGCWIMHEFSIVQPLLHNRHEASDYVLCRIKQKDPNSATGQKVQSKQEMVIIDDENGSPKRAIIDNIQDYTPLKAEVEPALPKIEAKQRQIVIACTNKMGARGVTERPKKMVPERRHPRTKSSGREPPLTSIPPVKPGNNKSFGLKLGCSSHKQGEVGINANGQKGVRPQSRFASITSSSCAQGPSLVTDCDGLIEAHATQDPSDGELDRYTDWALYFAEELLQDQPPQSIKQNEIEMLPNKYYEEKWVDWEMLP